MKAALDGFCFSPSDNNGTSQRGFEGLLVTPSRVAPPPTSARSALFFDGARITGPILVLVGWAAVGTLLALALGGRTTDPVDTEAAAAAGASV